MALCIKVYKLYNKSDDDARIQFQKEEEEEDKEEEERMPLANKEVVHLKHGWEKIQVGTKTRDDDDDDDDARFSFFRVLERATLRTHHHHLHFLNRISKKKRCFVFFPRAN